MQNSILMQNITVYLVPLLLVALLFSKSIADVITVMAGVVFLIYSYREKEWQWIKDPVIICALILVIYCLLIVSPFADKPMDTAIRSILWLRFLLLYALLKNFLSNGSTEINRSFFVTIIVFFIVSIDCLYQYNMGVSFTGNIVGTNRLSSFLDRPNIGTFLFKSIFAFASFFIAAQLAVKKSNDLGVLKKNKILPLNILFYFVWSLVTAMILLSGERSVTIMMVGSFFILIPFFLLFDKSLRKWAPVIIILTGGIVTTAVITQPNLIKRIEDLKTHLGEFRQSPYGHITFASWEIAKENPITGIGQKAFQKNCEDKIDPGNKNRLCHPHPHNPYLEWLNLAGFPGLLIYCALVLSILYNLLNGPWHQARLIVTALALSALSISLFPFLFSQSLISNWPGILAWLSIGLATAGVKLAKKIE